MSMMPSPERPSRPWHTAEFWIWMAILVCLSIPVLTMP